jgi:hypothetical protein
MTIDEREVKRKQRILEYAEESGYADQVEFRCVEIDCRINVGVSLNATHFNHGFQGPLCASTVK